MKNTKKKTLLISTGIIAIIFIITLIWLWTHPQNNINESLQCEQAALDSTKTNSVPNKKQHKDMLAEKNAPTLKTPNKLNEKSEPTSMTPPESTKYSPVPPQIANKAAASFLQSEIIRAAKDPKNGKDLSGFYIDNTETITGGDEATLAYVYHLSPTGFIITSASTGIRPVVAFSFQDPFVSQESSNNKFLSFIRQDMKTRLKLLENQSDENRAGNNISAWEQINNE